MNNIELAGRLELPLSQALITFPLFDQVSGEPGVLKMTWGEHSDRVMLEQLSDRQPEW